MRAFRQAFRGVNRANFISDLLVKHLRVKFLAVGDVSALALVVKAISCYYRKLAWIRLRYHQYANFLRRWRAYQHTAVRQALADDNLALAESLLGTRLPSPGV